MAYYRCLKCDREIHMRLADPNNPPKKAVCFECWRVMNEREKGEYLNKLNEKDDALDNSK